MKKIILSLYLLLTMLAGSCKKDKPLTLEQKILGKWTWVSSEVFQIPAAPSDETTNHPAGSYWEFKADKSLTVGVTGNPTSNYTWFEVDNNSFTVDNDLYIITIPTPKQLVVQTEIKANGVSYISKFTLSKP